MAEFENDNPICRICMAGKTCYISIVDNESEKNEPAMHEMISECIRYKVEFNDNLPRKVCLQCAEDIKVAYRFKKRAEESYRELCLLYQKQVEDTAAKIEKETQTDKNVYPCELCRLKFYDPLELQTHRKTEHQGVERKCRYCNKSFELLRQLKSHLIKDHPDQYIASHLQCKICERKFSRRDHLNRHMKNIHKTDPKRVHALEATIEHPIDCVEVVSKDDWNNENDSLVKNPIMSDSDEEMGDNSHNVNFDSIFHKNIKEEVDNDVKDLKSTRTEHPENVVIKVEFPNYESEYHDFEQEAHASTESNHEEENTNDECKNILKSETSSTEKSNYKRRNKGDGTPQENRCNICERVFSRQCHLRRHTQSAHTNEKPHACKHCDKRFTRSDHLKMHVLNLHEIKAHKCDMCDKAFVKNEALLRHKEVRHGDASGVYKIHECEYCKRKFTGKRYLARHRLLHTDRIFACRFCEATFKDRKLFREHERQHSSTQRNFLCSICGESFVRNDYLRVHMRRHLGEKPYKCQYCGKGFPRATDLKVHERYHTGTKPNVCSICGKAFHRAYNLTIHMRIHTGEKPYKCDHCSKSFAQSNDLKAHVRRHTGERFKCQQCDASFLQLYGLRQHALSVHGIHIESSTGRLQKVGCLAESTNSEFVKLTTTATTPTDTASLNATSRSAASEESKVNLNLMNNTLPTQQESKVNLNLINNTLPTQQPNLMPLDHHQSCIAAPPLHPQMHHHFAPPLALIYPNVPTVDAFKNQLHGNEVKFM